MASLARGDNHSKQPQSIEHGATTTLFGSHPQKVATCLDRSPDATAAPRRQYDKGPLVEKDLLTELTTSTTSKPKQGLV